VPDGRLKCALLTRFPYWPGEALLACDGLEIVAFPAQAIGSPEDENPFRLPEDDRADVALIGAWWWHWLEGNFPDRAAQVMREVERRADVLVGIDGPDRFSLTFTPAAMKRFDVVIKVQGLYRDRDLYNYVVGPDYDGGSWTEKRRPRPERYDSSDLEKLRLSVPSFVTEFPAARRRSRVRESTSAGMSARRMRVPERLARDLFEEAFARALGIAPSHGRTRDVHCLTGLSHVQRIEAMRQLEGLSGTLGIAPTQGEVPRIISGTEYGGRTLPEDLARALVDQARPYWRAPVGRLGFLADMRRHKVAVAPTGYGEIGNRHGMALLTGTALVCQDLSHVEMMLPLAHMQNVAFCRPDLSDLRATVDRLLADDALRARIGRAGRAGYMAWASDWRRLLSDGLESHIREAARRRS
jgi:hypothetical protein